ncbi:hypothetical protein McanMca71_001860 [Microsporum canis]
MPTLKQLTCHIEWANCSVPFKEYSVTYGDGSVECLIPIQPASTPFSIRLTSSGYIAPGLAMFVYIDGVYQCNRNRDDLILRKPSGKVKKRTQNVNFCVRQKEERLTDGSWIGRPWRFEPLQIVQLMPGMPEINRSHFDNLGQICVVVLRCESPCDQYSSEGSLSPESAMAFGPNLDDLQSISSDECFLQSSDTDKENDTSCGIMGGLFDGVDDYRHREHDIQCCESCVREERQGNLAGREGHRSPRNHENFSRRHHASSNRLHSRCQVHWEDKPRRIEVSDWEKGWESYDNESTASSDCIYRGYRYYRSSGPTDPIYKREAEDSDSPRFYSRHYLPKQRQSLSRRPKEKQSPEQKDRKIYGKLPLEETMLSQNPGAQEIHSGNRGCAPSIVLNVNSTLPAQRVEPETNHPWHQCATARCCTEDDTTDDACYIVSNDEKISRKCLHHSRARPCCKHREPSRKSKGNARDTPAKTDNDGNHNGNWDTSNGNQNNDSSSWSKDQGDAKGNSGNNTEVPADWNGQTENQNYTTNETSWDQGQGDQGANGNPDDWNKNNSNSGSNMLGQQENPTSDNDNKSSGQDWLAQNMDSGNGDAPAAGWPSNNSNDNGRNNYNSQHAPLTSPNNGYSNPQQVPSSPPPPPIIPAQAQGPMWETPPPIQRVHTLITPFCQGPEASEPPLYTVPEQVAQERSLSHQVQVGKSSIYSHKIKVPQYIDTMEEPYAKFVFKYRVKGVIESEIGKSIERDVEAERKLLESLPREEILNQLLHAQGLLAAQALGQPLTVPYQVQQHQRTNSRNQQYAPVQQQSSPPSNINNHNQRSQPGPTHWNSAPAQEELLTVPSKLTGYNDRSINAPQSPQNGNWAAKLTAGLQDVQQQQQNGSNHSNDAAPAWNAQAGQDEAGTKW